MIDTNIVTSIGDLYDIAVNADGYGPCYSLCRYGIMYNADALEKAGLPAPTSYEGLFDDQYAHMVALPDMTIHPPAPTCWWLWPNGHGRQPRRM